MQITIHLDESQISLLAQRMGYKEQIEDTTQPLDGDTYPIIDNPLSLQQFTEEMINQTLMNMILDRLRSEARTFMDNEYNKVTEKLREGGYDQQIMTLTADQLLDVILGDIANG